MTQARQSQDPPGRTAAMTPRPDCGEESYRGHGRLDRQEGGHHRRGSGIGRAVALAYAREGADVVLSYLNEKEDAEETAQLVRDAGRTAVLVPGDIAEPSHSRALIDRPSTRWGGWTSWSATRHNG